MLLLVGLGNPGEKHARNRHNVGFMALDAIHRRHGFPPWRRRFQGEAAEGTLGDVKTLLLKPQTYMNLSGQSVGEAAGFFKLAPEAIIVIHDEVDLPPGKIRMKNGGGAAGHNGLRSTSGAIGDGYRRLRIGVGHPGDKSRVPGYVLHDFAKTDGEWLQPLIDAIGEYAPLLAEGKDSTFGSRIHEALRPNEPAGEKKSADKKPRTAEPASPQAEASAKEDEGGPLARGLKKLFGLKS